MHSVDPDRLKMTSGRVRVLAVIAAAATLSPSASTGHPTVGPALPDDFWIAWSLQLSIILPIVVSALLYARGLQLAWRKAGVGRGVLPWRAMVFFLGIVALWAALVWPLDAMGEGLFSAHMGQHILLMGGAAPLLVLGLPLPTMIRALPRKWHRGLAQATNWRPWRKIWGVLTRADLATILQLIAFSFWHLPSAIALSLKDEFVHSLMHSSLFGSALLFWTAIARMRSVEFGMSVLGLVLTFKFSLIVGALLAFAPRSFYGSYGERGLAWALTPLEDQRLAGLLMMVVGSMMYGVAMLILVAVWFRSMESRTGAARDLRQIRARAR